MKGAGWILANQRKRNIDVSQTASATREQSGNLRGRRTEETILEDDGAEGKRKRALAAVLKQQGHLESAVAHRAIHAQSFNKRGAFKQVVRQGKCTFLVW